MKKKILFLLILNLTAGYSFAQLTSRVDERFELTSIVFRLAGAEEYVNNRVVNYAKDIDAYFEKYKEHPLIQYVKEIRLQDEVAYDAVSSSTFLLEIKNNKVLLNPQINKDAFLKEEPRWKAATLDKYIKLLNQFYKDAKFRTFYNQHKDLYMETEKRFDELLTTIHPEWFESFFGNPFGNPAIYLSLCNGNSNYALSSYNKNGSLDYGILIGCSIVDKEGIPDFITGYNSKEQKPYYDRDKMTVIIHEFSHHFSNPIISKYEPEMMEAANKIFPYVKEQLAKVAYGFPESILFEGFNELFTNIYFQDYLSLSNYNVARDERYGFIWMRRAIGFMENFSANRNLYASIEDFVPQLVSFINLCGNNIEQIVDEYHHKAPYVVNVFPSLNTTVSADVKEIRVDFSHPMYGSYGIHKSKQSDLIIPDNDPASKRWSDDRRTLFIPVTLEKDKNYGLTLPAGPFQSWETYPMKEDFEIIFKTEQ